MDLEKESLEAAALDGDAEIKPEPDVVDDPSPSPATIQKTNDILDACRWNDTARLRRLAQSSGGFLADDLRQLAWPILLGLPPSRSEECNGDADADADDGSGKPTGSDWRRLPRHRDEDQVQLDVNRSFVNYPDDRSDAEISRRKKELSSLIGEVLRRNPYLCYFQGYHDICQVFLLVLRPELRARAVSRLSVLRIRDFMLPSLAPTTAQLRLLPDVLTLSDPELRRHVAGIEPYYALAGTLTMYSHNIEGYHDIARMFDVILAREPVFTIYMFAQIVMDRREEILDIDEHDMLQVILGRVPKSMDLDALVKKAVGLYERFPPERLPSWRRISGASALKTARDLDACAKQTLEDGHRFFERQAREVHWQEVQGRIRATAWAYRRPAGMFAMAVVVGCIAMHLRRNPSTLHSIMGFFSFVWRGL
ncbi:GTPase-activating protein gyp10 [Escovopsis weberi]|uniref:GTPase-activating protein gyp10 n=1 Tax=Escovopsis weberi TaxID=150374 RepID=A0A0M8MYP7_ESCWE|nr:GTPase-activating protein gyp10 [Escovopsis weberi]